ncbi:MAG: response regulator [Candidatus Competibacteraceae bacterium]|jgi:PAS domain S-box-containing protein|nr:response regulator [Candidatus Competibacteraceae bacterium]
MDKILIADSDVVALKQCATILQTWADTVVTVTDGAQALAAWRQIQPQVMVLAATLPDWNCGELVKELRQTAHQHTSAKILLTADLEEHDAVQQGLAAGADDFIWKPLPHRELVMRVQRFLYERPPSFQSESTAPETVFRLNEASVRNIITATPIGICITNETGIFEYVNPAYETIYGYTSAELIGQHFTVIVPDPYKEQLSVLHDQYIQGKAEVQGEWSVVGKNGQLFTILGNAALIVGPDGGRKKVTFVVDINRRKQAEEALEKAKIDAEQANQAKSDFLVNISHELRTPLTSIMGLADIMSGSPLNEQQQHWLTTVSHASENLLSLINDLLDYSKLEINALQLENSAFALPSLLKMLKDTLQPWADRKHLELAFQVPAALPEHVQGDPLRLRQVLLNLLHNALKFTDQGKVLLRITQQPTLHPDTACRLTFEINDSGIGMESRTIEELFKPFFQNDSSATRRYGGTGLGLAICQRLVELMGGEIKVFSESGRGSTFAFTLDFRRAADKREQPNHLVTAQNPLRGRLILVADDYPPNQEIAELQLRTLGGEVHFASDGYEAVRMVKQQSYDAVFMDIQMPNLDGFEATRRIRSHEAATHTTPVPIIALTADIDSPERRRVAEEAGMNDYVTKPFNRATLNAVLSRWLREDYAVVDDEPISLPPLPLRAPDPAEEIRRALRQLVDDLSPSGALTVLKTTMVHVPKQLDALLEALAAQDWATASRAAHRLKGTAKLYGSNRLIQMLMQVEQQTNLATDANTVAVDLAGEYELVLRQIKQQIERLEV